MTRLIDADALRGLLDYDNDSIPAQVLKATFVAAIDAAPAVCCERCDHWRPWTATGSPDFCCCGNEIMDGVMDNEGRNPPAGFGCNRFKAIP